MLKQEYWNTKRCRPQKSKHFLCLLNFVHWQNMPQDRQGTVAVKLWKILYVVIIHNIGIDEGHLLTLLQIRILQKVLQVEEILNRKL